MGTVASELCPFSCDHLPAVIRRAVSILPLFATGLSKDLHIIALSITAVASSSDILTREPDDNH